MYLQQTISVNQTIDLIKQKIKSNEPFAFSRFGDGEIHALNRNFEPQFEFRGCSEWGYQYPHQIQQYYDDSTSVILNSIKHSDVIGLMDKNNEIAKSMTYRENVWSIKVDFLESKGIDTSKLIITDHMLPRMKEFGYIDSFKKILQGKSLNIISPNTEHLKKKNLSKLLDSDVTFTHQPKSINLRNRNEFIESFKNIKSEVVIVGCGLQKDFVVYLRHNYGKVAIDVGAVLDAWSGLNTRHWFDKGGKQEYLML